MSISFELSFLVIHKYFEINIFNFLESRIFKMVHLKDAKPFDIARFIFSLGSEDSIQESKLHFLCHWLADILRKSNSISLVIRRLLAGILWCNQQPHSNTDNNQWNPSSFLLSYFLCICLENFSPIKELNWPMLQKKFLRPHLTSPAAVLCCGGVLFHHGTEDQYVEGSSWLGKSTHLHTRLGPTLMA